MYKSKNNIESKYIRDLVSESCISEETLNIMINEYRRYRTNNKTGNITLHLQPILLSYYDNDNNNRVNEIKSQEFRTIVNDYYGKLNCIVNFVNDSNNKYWKIYLYPKKFL